MRLGLFLGCAVALTGAIPASAQTAVHTIELFSYGYSPKVIRMRAGQPVTLQFVNRSGKGHDFTAREFFAASRITAGQVRNGEIDLKGGESTSVTLVPARGTYKVHCGHPFHKPFGMKGTIVVR